MSDLLIKLYDLPPMSPVAPAGVALRRALGPEKHQVVAWVARRFSRGWADECELAFNRQPLACYLALDADRLAGFCVYDATARGMLGPVGVDERIRGRGVGRSLLVATLNDMAAQGYAYAVVGWAGPEAFFVRTVGAIPIPGSRPGIYGNMLTGRIHPPRKEGR